jgi:hypothetical protein
MWGFYWAGSEIVFRHQEMLVFQIHLAKRQGAVPLTRDYIGQAEERLRPAERAKPMRLAACGYSKPPPNFLHSQARIFFRTQLRLSCELVG